MHRLTDKQAEIMRLAVKGSTSGDFISLKELHYRLSYGHEVSEQAIQASIRYMEQKGLVTRKYEMRFNYSAQWIRTLVIVPTEKGYNTAAAIREWVRPKTHTDGMG